MFGIYGLAVDEPRGLLWACTYDDRLHPAQPAALKAYALATGVEQVSHPMPGDSGFCNDVVIDATGTVYASDSFANAILRVAPGGQTIETWATSDQFAAEPWSITVNGLVHDGGNHLYVVKYDSGELFSIEIRADGSAAEPVKIPVEPALVAPDGIELVDAQTLLVVENTTGQVVTVHLTNGRGHKTVIASGLIDPTTAAILGDDAWVVEGQMRLFGTGERPTLPFAVHRIALP
jgi:sugar lactone lactonase YvrE